jgi:pentatricopeptide repeat domain-containing protein 1
MEATGRGLFPNKPTLPTGPRKRVAPLLPAAPPPPSPSSLPLDSLLLHLTAAPAPAPSPTQRRSHSTPTPAQSFLSPAARALVLDISSHPVNTLPDFLESRRDELLRSDIPSLLKALELSGHWEWALALVLWAGAEGAADAASLEMVVRALGREGQHDAVCTLLDEMPLPSGSRLDVRAYTTVLHALSRARRYERAIKLFDEMRGQGVAPTLVTYNVVIDVYGRMGRSWPRIVTLLEEMRAAGVEPDDFTSSTVIAACCRDGLVDEAVAFF